MTIAPPAPVGTQPDHGVRRLDLDLDLAPSDLARDHDDPRLAPVDPRLLITAASVRRRAQAMLVVCVVATLWYFSWLLSAERVGHPALYGLLVAAELFNLTQALGFWWTIRHERSTPRRAWTGSPVAVDVLVPTYNEPVAVVEPVVAAATRLRGAEVRVALLDDGRRPEMAALAARHGVRYVVREERSGAKAGNLNSALRVTDAPFVLVLDCDHVVDEEFLLATLGHLEDPDVGFVQTPQYYANADRNAVAAASWSQQALFFGAIARGKDGLGAMFCCGTGVLFRREALEAVGGLPTDSVTEDFQLSLRMHEAGWRSVYMPEVLTRGLGPEDMSAYASQQLRWARGCLGALPAALRARLPWRVRAQYALSSMYFLTGWTVLLYLTLPVVKLLTGVEPIAAGSVDAFVAHFVPYLLLSLGAVAVAGGGRYTFLAFAVQSASCWIHVVSTLRALTRRRSSFVVTPKERAGDWHPRAVAPAVVLVAALVGASAWGLARELSPENVNAAAFALLHVVVLARGASLGLGLRRSR